MKAKDKNKEGFVDNDNNGENDLSMVESSSAGNSMNSPPPLQHERQQES